MADGAAAGDVRAAVGANARRRERQQRHEERGGEANAEARGVRAGHRGEVSRRGGSSRREEGVHLTEEALRRFPERHVSGCRDEGETRARQQLGKLARD
jgi:hypothetical protein